MGRLAPDVRRRLLAVVRAAVERRVRDGAPMEPPGDLPLFAEKRGVFVTIHEGGELRGCIGYPLPIKPLGEALVECAVAAALHDPRFPPVSAAELPRLGYEVSILTVPRRAAAEEVVPGEHGVIVSQGGERGLLLPQVATEHGWDRETFLAHTCRKAGLAPDAWRKGAAIEVFTAEVIAEAE